MIRHSRLVSIVAGASAPLVVLGSARAQLRDASAAIADDGGAPPRDIAAPPGDAAAPVDASTASPLDAASAAPASPPPAYVVLPEPMTEVVAAPSPVTDVQSPSFGRRRQIVVSGDSSINLTSSTFSGSAAKQTRAVVSPSLAYFVAKNVSVGLAVDASYSDYSDNIIADLRSTTLSAGPTIGCNLPFGERFSWYPQLTAGFEWTRQTQQLVPGPSRAIVTSPLGYPDTTQFGPYVRLYAPFLLHATDHFFFGFGPGFFHDFGGVSTAGANVGGQRTEVFMDFIVGGYWGGEPAPPAPVRSSAPLPRFGQAGQFVFTNDLNLSAHWWTYAGADSSEVTTLLGGSVDYFIVNHFALGAAVGISGSSFKGYDSVSGAPVTTSNSALSFGPLLGVNFEIGRFFSVFPRLSLTIAHQRSDETSGSSANASTDDIFAVGLYVPLLVHPAPHVFVGFGPNASYELSHSVSFPNDPLAPAVQNREATWGGGLVVGGWL